MEVATLQAFSLTVQTNKSDTDNGVPIGRGPGKECALELAIIRTLKEQEQFKNRPLDVVVGDSIAFITLDGDYSNKSFKASIPQHAKDYVRQFDNDEFANPSPISVDFFFSIDE